MKSKRMLGAFTFILLSCLMLPSQTVATAKTMSKNVTFDMVSKIKVGSSNRVQVMELLGTPWRTVDYGDCNPVDYQEVWEYLSEDAAGVYRISIEFDEAGIARIITKTSPKGPVIVLAAAPAPRTTHQH